mgnify:CR=1 FL=1
MDDFSTGKDIVVLAANLSSKYVLTATRAAYKVTRIQLEICIRERDKLKQKLAEINRLLEIEYAKDTQQGGFYKGFGGGGFGGGGAGGRW